MTDNDPGVEQGIKSGIGDISFKSWHDVVTYFHRSMLTYDSYIWRGQRQSGWRLAPALDRHMEKRQISPYHGFVEQHLERFKFAARGRRGPNPQAIPDGDENEWWALAQHHGMATPLLDWTASPFVAAYFAFFEEDSQDQTEHRVIYGLSRPSIEEKAKLLQDTRNEQNREAAKDSTNLLARLLREGTARPDVEFIKPLTEQNQRLISQNGLFTRAPQRVYLEDWIRRNFESEEDYILMRLLIPNRDRENCLRTLNRMNINHLTLFPDLDGASKYCNLSMQIENY